MKIGPVGAKLLHEDRRTDTRDEDNSRFTQLCKHTYNDHDDRTKPSTRFATGKSPAQYFRLQTSWFLIPSDKFRVP